MVSDLTERLRDFTTRDHERGCLGREYVCSCGYDNDLENAAEEAADTIDRLTRERDAAFSMSNCECGADEACRNLVMARDKALEDAADEIKKLAEAMGRIADHPEASQKKVQAAIDMLEVAETVVRALKEKP